MSAAEKYVRNKYAGISRGRDITGYIEAFQAGECYARQEERARILKRAEEQATSITSGHGQSDKHIWLDTLIAVINEGGKYE